MTTRATLLLVCLALAGCKKPQPTDYTSPDGQFKVKFPGEPNVTTTGAKGLVVKMYAVETWSTVHLIGWSDVPIPEWESASRTRSRLFDARDGALAAVNGKSGGTTKTIHIGPHPGIEFGGSADGKHVRARVYIVGHRLYQVLLAARESVYLTSAAADEFFDSFELIDAPATGAKIDADGDGKPDEPAPSPEPATGATNLISSAGGKFKAKYPADPAKVTKTVGDVAFTGYAAESAAGSCTVGYADLPEEPADAKQRLEAARDAAVADFGGKRTTSKPMADAGVEFSAAADGRFLHGRIFLSGKRLYQITVRGTADFVASADAAVFLDSFQITK